MTEELKVGLLGEKEKMATKDKTALALGSGNMDVYATPCFQTYKIMTSTAGLFHQQFF